MPRTKQASFTVTDEQRDLIRKIAKRADTELYSDPDSVQQSRMDTEMDLCACIAQGVPLRLAELLAADAPHFGHDVGGIRRHIDRRTGKLGNGFLPRYFDSEAAKAAGAQ